MLVNMANMAYDVQPGQNLTISYLGGTLPPTEKRYVKVEKVDAAREQFTGFDVQRRCFRTFKFNQTLIMSEHPTLLGKISKLFRI